MNTCARLLILPFSAGPIFKSGILAFEMCVTGWMREKPHGLCQPPIIKEVCTLPNVLHKTLKMKVNNISKFLCAFNLVWTRALRNEIAQMRFQLFLIDRRQMRLKANWNASVGSFWDVHKLTVCISHQILKNEKKNSLTVYTPQIVCCCAHIYYLNS